MGSSEMENKIDDNQMFLSTFINFHALLSTLTLSHHLVAGSMRVQWFASQYPINSYTTLLLI